MSNSNNNTPRGNNQVSLLSLNLHAWKLDGTKWNKVLGSLIERNRARFHAIAELVVQERVTIIALQEACVFQGHSAIAEIAEALQKLTGERWSYHWASAHTAWAGTHDECEEGVGIIARGAGSVIDPEVLEYETQGPFRRVAVSATVPTVLGHLRVYSVHLEVMSREARSHQARETAIHALVRTDPRFNAVIMGDFNDEIKSSTLYSMTSMGFVELANTRSGIDHVFVHRASGFRVVEDREVFTGAGSPVVSDHPGILARLTFEPELQRFAHQQRQPASVAIHPTRIIVHCDAGWNHRLSIRGEVAHPHAHALPHNQHLPSASSDTSASTPSKSTSTLPSSSRPSSSTLEIPASLQHARSFSKSSLDSTGAVIADLSWKKGWPLVNVGPSEWRIVLTEVPSSGYFVKVLKDDQVWQQGDNIYIGAGLENYITPTF